MCKEQLIISLWNSHSHCSTAEDRLIVMIKASQVLVTSFSEVISKIVSAHLRAHPLWRRRSSRSTREPGTCLYS